MWRLALICILSMAGHGEEHGRDIPGVAEAGSDAPECHDVNGGPTKANGIGPGGDLRGKTRVTLHQNHPNPSSIYTVIAFSLSKSGPVSLRLYTAKGTPVGTLVDGYYLAGMHRVKFSVDILSSGLYWYGLQSVDSVYTRRMMVVQ